MSPNYVVETTHAADQFSYVRQVSSMLLGKESLLGDDGYTVQFRCLGGGVGYKDYNTPDIT